VLKLHAGDAMTGTSFYSLFKVAPARNRSRHDFNTRFESSFLES
jgi:hypothetical protein